MTDDRDCTQRAYLYLARDVDVTGPPYSDRDLELMAFDPDEVTALVGLAPTSAWRRGDPGPLKAGPTNEGPPSEGPPSQEPPSEGPEPQRSGPPWTRRFSKWEYSPPETATCMTEDVVVALLDAIEPYGRGLDVARRTLGLLAGITVVIEMGSEPGLDGEPVVCKPVIAYAAATIRRLACLDLAVDHDQYVYV